MRSLAIALAVLAMPAHAELVLKTENVTFTLLTQKCTHKKVLALLNDDWVKKMKQGHVLYEGRSLQMCWTNSRAGHVVIIDEDGDGVEIPLSRFKEKGA